MKTQLWKKFVQLTIWKDERGQDMVEYALLAGFITIAAGAVFPPASDNISIIFSKLTSIMDQS